MDVNPLPEVAAGWAWGPPAHPSSGGAGRCRPRSWRRRRPRRERDLRAVRY